MHSIEERIRATIREILPEIVGLRHELHRHPELHFEEHWTSDRISAFLENAGIDHTRGHARGTGIVAVIEGARPGPAVALRADMDALALREATGLPYASEIPGRMHACGHDGHSACLCGAGKALAMHRDTLAGTVKLIFQPAEEEVGGGRDMVEEGVLDGTSAVFALHAWPSLPAGAVAIGLDRVMASADFFRIDVYGKGGHGADPAATVDPVLVAAHIVTALQSVVGRELDPWEAAVLTVAHIESGSSTNIIPEHAWMEGTLRALTPEVRATLAQSTARIASCTAEAFRAVAETTLDGQGYPALSNDPGMAQLAREAASAVLGPGAVHGIPHPYMVAEDFAFYLERVPGAFIFLGNGAPGGGGSPNLHTSCFDFNDDAIPVALDLMTAVALAALGRAAQ